MKEIKFRAWDKVNKKMFIPNQINGYGTIIVDVWHKEENGFGTHQEEYPNPYILMQYTGLKDKNNKEIYELCELNNKYRVLFKELKYILQDISNNDIIEMEFNSQLYEITREYSPI